MHPVRRTGGYVHRSPWCHGVRGDLWLQGLDSPVGAVPVPVELVSSGGVTLEAPHADGLAATDLHQQAVLDVKVDRRDRIWGGDEDEGHPPVHLAPLAALLGDQPRLELVEIGVHELRHAGIGFHVEQGEPGVCVVQIAYHVARSLQGSPGRTPLRDQKGLCRGVGDHRSARQAVGEIRDCGEGHAIIAVEIMSESHGSPGERIVEWNLSYRLLWWLCPHHSPLSNWVPILSWTHRGRRIRSRMSAPPAAGEGLRQR